MAMQKMVERYNAGESTSSLAAAFDLNPSSVQRKLRAVGVVLRPAGFRSGPAHHAWTGGRVEHEGYVLVLVHADNPFYSMARIKSRNSNGGRYILEHRLVMAQKLGRILADHETVHHKDTNTLNNHPDNLQLRQGRHGKGGVFHCADCGSHNIVATELAEMN